MSLTTEEKKQMMDEMDTAADIARTEFRAMSQHITVPIARFWLENYLKTGHKRLGRMMVAYAKEMAKTSKKDWADADENYDNIDL